MAAQDVAHELDHGVHLLGGAGEHVVDVALIVGEPEGQALLAQGLVGIGAVVGVAVGVGHHRHDLIGFGHEPEVLLKDLTDLIGRQPVGVETGLFALHGLHILHQGIEHDQLLQALGLLSLGTGRGGEHEHGRQHHDGEQPRKPGLFHGSSSCFFVLFYGSEIAFRSACDTPDLYTIIVQAWRTSVQFYFSILTNDQSETGASTKIYDFLPLFQTAGNYAIR